MFKNLTIYRLVAGWPLEGASEVLENALDAARFLECGASQEKSVGWIEPRGHEHGAMVEVIGGQWLLKLMIETRTVPADVVKRKVDEQLGAIEAATGRKPGKKERREITEDVRLSLLPMAFAKQSSAQVWVDPTAGLLMVDGHNDEVITWLIKAVGGLAVQLVNTQTSPAAAMAGWLSGDAGLPLDFSVDRECELKACDESRAVVKYGRHALDTDEVRQHIAMGKIPTRLALTWADRVSFVLTDGLHFKKITFLESAFEGGDGGAADAFDSDAVIATGELRRMIPALLAELGGEVRPLPALPALPGARK